MQVLPTGTITLLFTDIEGSTQLLQRLGELYATALSDHHTILRASIKKFNGLEIDTQGDAFFVVFSRASDAIHAVVEAQRMLAAHVWPSAETVLVRMGLHTGEAALTDSGYVGIDVHRAARICSAGHGGQVLISQTTHDLVEQNLPESASLRDLGEHRLKDLRQPEHIFQLVLADLPADFPPLKSLNVIPHNLPIQLTDFVGRDHEMAEIKQLLNEGRLVTLTGPGGVGKTRIALHAAAAVITDYLHGVYFVSLEALSAPEFIAPAIVSALNLSLQGPLDPKAQLLNYLQARSVLLILDNCEHLLEGIEVVTNILRTCPSVKILATSRERLNLEEEWILLIEGFEVPAEGLFEDIEANSAVRLFTQRARHVKPDFKLAATDQFAVTHICRLLEGMPLGIELAAAWVNVIPCAEIANEIERNFDFLNSSRRNVLERHRSMRAVFEYSWNLLSKEEQVAFRQLAVFKGGFRREAAQAVASASLSVLAAFVDKSLLRVNASSGRYDRHPLMNQLANEKLDILIDERKVVQSRHAQWYAAFLEQHVAQLTGDHQKEVITEVEEEIENIRLALEVLKDNANANEAEQQVKLYEGLGDILTLTGRQDEARLAFQNALTYSSSADRIGQARFNRKAANTLVAQRRPIESLPLLTQAEIVLGASSSERDMAWQQEWIEIQLDRAWTLYWLGEVSKMTQLIDQVRPIIDRYARPLQRSKFFRSLVLLAYRRDRYLLLEETLVQARAGLDASRESGNRADIGYSEFILGFTHMWRDELNEAEQHLQTALNLTEQTRDMERKILCLNYLAVVYRKRGQLEAAEQYSNRTMIAATGARLPTYVAFAKANLAWLAWRKQNLTKVQEYGAEAIEIWRRQEQEVPLYAFVLWPLLAMALSQRQISEAIRYAREMLPPPQLILPKAMESSLRAAIVAYEGGDSETVYLNLNQAARIAQESGYL